MTGTSASSAPSPERARLTAALRELRTRTGLSLAGLAERTAYSKSSWERYLNGKALPPRQAVRDLCRLAREPEGRCLALWEIAEAQWRGRGTPPAQPPPEPAPRPARPAAAPGGGEGAGRRRGPAAVTLLVLLCVLAVSGGVALTAVLLAGRDGTTGASRTAAPPSPSGPRCRGAGCEGQNPTHMMCGGAPRTLSAHRTATGARVELRYSAECRAGWARMWGTRVGDRLEVTAGGPATASGSRTAATPTSTSTRS